VAAAGIVTAFDELEDGHPCLSFRREGPAVQEFGFERREEALAHRVVIGIADRSHRGANTCLLAPQTEGDRCVLRSLVRVMDDIPRLSLRDRHVEGLKDKFGFLFVTDRPTYNPSTEGIKDDRQVDEACPGRDEGDVVRRAIISIG
jgi:hypothetical protein